MKEISEILAGETAYIGYRKDSDTTYSYNLGVCCTFEKESEKIELCIKENSVKENLCFKKSPNRIEEGWVFFTLNHFDDKEEIDNNSQVVKECVDLIKNVYKALIEN